mgnify:CR=1 FL=1
MPSPASKVSGSQPKLFFGLLLSATLLASCGGGGTTLPPPPLVNVCERAFGAVRFANRGLRRTGDSRSGTLGPSSDVEFYYDRGRAVSVRDVPPRPGTFTFYGDAYYYFPSAANVTGVTIRLTSPVFDPFLRILGYDADGNFDRNIDFVNDDAAPGNFTTSQLTIPVRQDRCYLLAAESYWAQNAPPTAGRGSPGRGPYTIEVVSETFATPPPRPPIQQKPADSESGGGREGGGI